MSIFMSVERDRMIKALKEYVVPVLRVRGFKGSFPHFRRPTSIAIHLLTFQFDKWGGGFTIEIALCPPEGVTMHSGEHMPASKVSAWDVYPPHRPRLGPEKTDKWFRFDNRGFLNVDQYERAALEVLPYIEKQAESWWSKEPDKKNLLD
jgi:Domain of unknown function (DUF4304)